MSKRLISAALVLVLLAGILFHGIFYTRSMSDAKEEESQLTQTLHIWYTDECLTDYLIEAGVAFHEKNPDVRVIPTLVSSSEYVESVYSASIADENYPDLFIVSNDTLEKAYLSGIASEVDASTNVLNSTHFSQAALNAVTYNGQKVAYPLYFETSVLAYNKTYLEDWVEKVNSGEVEVETDEIAETELEGDAASDASNNADDTTGPAKQVALDDYIPKTIDDILDFAGSYSPPDGVDAIFKWDVTDVFYNYFFVGKYMVVGGPAGDDIQNIDIYNASAINSLEVYQNLNQFFSIDASTSSYNSVVSDFINGKSVYTIVTSDAIKKIREAQKVALNEYHEAREIAQRDAENRAVKEGALAMAGGKDQDKKDEKTEDGEASKTEEEVSELQKKADELKAKVFDIEFSRIPMISDKLEAKSLSVTSCIAVNGFSKNMEAANRFAAFATTTQAQSLYQKTGKIASSLDAVYEDEDLIVFRDEYANSIPLTKLMEASNFWVQLEITFTKIWSGEDVQSYVKALSEQLSKQSVEVSGE